MRTAVPLTPRTMLKTGSLKTGSRRGCFGFMIAGVPHASVCYNDGQPCGTIPSRVKIAPVDTGDLQQTSRMKFFHIAFASVCLGVPGRAKYFLRLRDQNQYTPFNRPDVLTARPTPLVIMTLRSECGTLSQYRL
jgi:hypothetical protein